MATAPATTAAYQRHKARARRRSAAQVLAGQDIGAIPPPADLARRAAADQSFLTFCDTYFPRLFTLPWSDDHHRVIAKIERVVCHGETFAVAMPRGSGKTTLCQTAVLWSILTGRHPFVFLIASTAEYALAMLNNIKSHLSSNDLLLVDYPEAIYPIRQLDGESRRCSGQRYYGVKTHIAWAADQVIMPTIPGSRSSGTVLNVAGITGNIRGALFIRPDGSAIRPTLAIIDDPQTDQSARSPSQVHERLSIINGAISGLAGPGKQVAMIMPCTVIRADDLADQVLDRKKNPLWQGERTKLVNKFPKNEKLWEQYGRLRAESFLNDGNGSQATEFYRKNREAMDKGADIAWPARFNRDELSAVQYAMNLKLRDARSFFAEYQNEPLPEVEPDQEMLKAEQIAAKTNGLPRGVIPMKVAHLTAFIDVQGKALFYVVAAWETDFTGYVIDYGTEPDQKTDYFTLREVKRTLARAVGNADGPGAITGVSRAGKEGAIYAGLERLTELLLSRDWKRDDGTTMRIEKCLIDANWGETTDLVKQFCRQSKYTGILLPSHGSYFGAASVPISDYKAKPGERIGLNWLIPLSAGRPVRHVRFDTNWWKTFVQSRLATAMGDPGCLSLFGRDAQRHRLIAEHLTAEYRTKTQGRGREVDEWKLNAGRDNHWLDCLVGAAVAGSMLGVTLPGMKPPRKVNRISFAELQRKKRREYGLV